MRKQSKFLSYLGVLLFAIVSFFSIDVRAQYLINQTSFTPIRMPKVTTQYLSKAAVGENTTFTGTAYYSDGQLTHYSGCLYFPDGSYSSCARFTPDFRCPDGCEYMFIDAQRINAYRVKIVNGQNIRQGVVNIKDRVFSLSGTSITFLDNAVAPAPSISSGLGSSSSNDNQSHKATCAGCHGSGRCQRCNGTGNRKNYANGNIENCTLCHGTGRCQSCAGIGFIYL